MKWNILPLVFAALFCFAPLTVSSATPDPVTVAAQYIGQTETEGFNRSPFIDKINAFAGVPMGSPYCAAFVSWVFHESGRKAVISAYSPDWFRKNLIPYSEIQRNDVFGLYFPSKGRIAHVGIIEGRKGTFWLTVEANTSPEATDLSAKSREGDGFFRRLRSSKLLEQSRNKFSRWNN